MPPTIVYTPTGRDATLISRRLASQNMPCVVCDHQTDLLDAAEAGRGPLLIAEEGLSIAGGQWLDRILNDQPTWSDLPVILLMQARHGKGTACQVLTRRSSVQWLRRPIDSHYLLSTLRLAVNSRQRQNQVASLLQEQMELNQQLKHRAEQLRNLTVELIEAEDHERARLADMLHDDLQGVLVAAALHLGAAEKQIGDNPRLREAIDQSRTLVKTAQRSSRSLSHELYPAALRLGDLKTLLDWLRHNAKQMFGVDLQVLTEPIITKIEPIILRFCYRAIQEMLCNVAKHAGVNSATLSLRCDSDYIELVVSDDGVGFDPIVCEQATDPSGLGLIMIGERTEALGGKMIVKSQPGDGCQITLLIPTTRSDRSATSDLPTTENGLFGEMRISSPTSELADRNEL